MQDAFGLYAFDYIIKPFKVERLYKTVERIVDYINEMTSTDPMQDKKKRLLLKIKDGMVMIKPEDIILVERVDRSTVVITENEEYVTHLNLADVEKVLPVGEFMRSHKSYIICVDKIRKIEIYGRWTYVVKFRGTEKDALMTKEKSKELEEKYYLF
jgi:two-component system LytT family response regulator